MTNRGAQSFEGVAALAPLGWVYAAGVGVVRSWHRAPAPPEALPRVVSVGNLEVGGNGKTPFAMWLLSRAAVAGKRVAYVSRGFASSAERGPLTTVVLAEGAPPPNSLAGLRCVDRHATDLARAIGDEGAMVAGRVPFATLAFARDKRRATEAAARCGVDLIVVDDAFQSFTMARHIDVILLDAARPLGNGRVLPAGRLRESPGAIARADVIVFNGAADVKAVDRGRERVARWTRTETKVGGMRRTTTLVAATRTAVVAPRDVLLVAGIARPDAFRQTVEANGVTVADVLAYRDHHSYTTDDVETIRRHASTRAIVTTEKDWVKLRRFEWGDAPIWIARLDVEWVGGDGIVTAILGS